MGENVVFFVSIDNSTHKNIANRASQVTKVYICIYANKGSISPVMSVHSFVLSI